MDSSVAPPYELIRPWRRATLVATGIALVEFLLLVSLALVVFGRPLERALGGARHVSSHSSKSRADVRPSAASLPAAVVRVVPRSRLKILVLNGNGRSGAAASAAASLRRIGYRIAATANATRSDYATSLVMYRPNFRPEGLRLARDLGFRVVGPLDGMRIRALMGAELAVILGA